MCLILFAYNIHPEYPLVLAANRDEFYRRQSLPAHWWQDHPDILAGKDLDGGGTWMGISRSGRLAAVTNVREGVPREGTYRSRGELPLTCLNNTTVEDRLTDLLMSVKDAYRGFNLLFGTLKKLYFFSNRNNTVQQLEPGIHGLSNASLNTPWPKVRQGKEQLALLLNQPVPDVQALFDLLADDRTVPDHHLPETGVDLEWERLLSAIHIRSEDYGTRSSSVLMIDAQGNASLHEKERAPREGPIKQFHFKIEI